MTDHSTFEIRRSHFLRLRLHKEFDEAFASTQLPERPDYAWANEFLLKARMGAVPPTCGPARE